MRVEKLTIKDINCDISVYLCTLQRVKKPTSYLIHEHFLLLNDKDYISHDPSLLNSFVLVDT